MTTIHFEERGFGSAGQLRPWSDLKALAIRTTGDGPWATDVFWLFVTKAGAFELPGPLVGSEQLRVLQERLEGFDNEKVIRAMGSAEERIFRVWHEGADRTRWHPEKYRARFRALVQRLGGEPGACEAVFEELAAAWGESHRRYHNREHLAECLEQLEGADVAELALWFHDAVYHADAPGNEERSAQLLLAACARLHIAQGTADAAASLVRATAHDSTAGEVGPDVALVLDVDLSILGAEVTRFMEYEYAIEEEFKHVPTFKFRLGRGRFLASLLARPFLFRTPLFRDRYETKARAQLTALLNSPRYRAFRIARWFRNPFRAKSA